MGWRPDAKHQHRDAADCQSEARWLVPNRAIARTAARPTTAAAEMHPSSMNSLLRRAECRANRSKRGCLAKGPTRASAALTRAVASYRLPKKTTTMLLDRLADEHLRLGF